MLSLKAGENKWGYKLNINHPEVAKWYRDFKIKIGEPIYAISDEERFKFECIMRMSYKHFGDNEELRQLWLKWVINKNKPLNNEGLKKFRESKKTVWLKVLKVLNKKAPSQKATELIKTN